MISIIILILILLIVLYNIVVIETMEFDNDMLRIPNNPSDYDEVQMRRLFRLVAVDQHIKLDKYDNIEKITFKKPKPELGETACDRVTCPKWMKNIACWKCH